MEFHSTFYLPGSSPYSLYRHVLLQQKKQIYKVHIQLVVKTVDIGHFKANTPRTNIFTFITDTNINNQDPFLAKLAGDDTMLQGLEDTCVRSINGARVAMKLLSLGLTDFLLFSSACFNKLNHVD